MNPASTASGDPHYPHVVGFDMPGGEGQAGQGVNRVMVALLDVVPARQWSIVFARHAQQFITDHALAELRLVGRNITSMGSAEVLRGLSSHVKALVHRVSRLGMQERVTRLADIDRPREGEGASDRSHGQPAKIDPSIRLDLEAIARIVGIPTILEAVTRATGMRFAAVARVTDTRWTACAVYDLIEFGLQPGQELVLESTICNEIRQHGRSVVIDDASSHPEFATHATPTMYGFASYISVPILRGDGSFFGTLCALDPEPAKLDDTTISTLEMFARMIGLELDPPEAKS